MFGHEVATPDEQHSRRCSPVVRPNRLSLRSMPAALFWIGFALIFVGAFAAPGRLTDVVMKDSPRKQSIRRLGMVAATVGGVLVLVAWLS